MVQREGWWSCVSCRGGGDQKREKEKAKMRSNENKLARMSSTRVADRVPLATGGTTQAIQPLWSTWLAWKDPLILEPGCSPSATLQRVGT